MQKIGRFTFAYYAKPVFYQLWYFDQARINIVDEEGSNDLLGLFLEFLPFYLVVFALDCLEQIEKFAST